MSFNTAPERLVGSCLYPEGSVRNMAKEVSSNFEKTLCQITERVCTGSKCNDDYKSLKVLWQ